MRKVHQWLKSRVLPLMIASGLLLSLAVPSAYAAEANIQINAATIYMDDTLMAAPGNNLDLSVADIEGSGRISFLYGDVLYISFYVLMETGIDFSTNSDDETKTVTLLIEPMDTHEGPAIPRQEGQVFAANEEECAFSYFGLTINGEEVIQPGENISMRGKPYPSSVFYVDNIFLPAEFILQKMGIATSWDMDTLTFSILYGSDVKSGLSNFSKTNRYLMGQFADVPSSTWYTNSVKAAFEYGLMVGNGANFNPEGQITIAEAVTIASRLHNTYYNKNYEFASGDPWYQSYVDYALENKIIPGKYSNYEAKISRSEFALIMANTFPLQAVNEVEDGAIPDITRNNDCYDAVYQLYRAGIISGTDTRGTFNPNAQISRAEVAVILSNMVDEQLRKTFTLKKPIYPTSITIKPIISLLVGYERKLSVTTDPEYITAPIHWSSTDPNVLSVSDEGVIVGKELGMETITASTENGVSNSCRIMILRQEDADIIFGKQALDSLKEQLKFPDTLEIFGMWAFTSSTGNLISITIYYSAMNPMGLHGRGEYQAVFNLDTGELMADDFRDKTRSHSTERPVDIDMVLSIGQ